MSELKVFSPLNEVELIKYYARKISDFCKDHRCATCHFYTPDGICKFLNNSPCDWKGIEEHETDN